MIKAIQFAVIGLLLCAAALCGFGCWAVYRLEPGAAALLTQATASTKSIGDAAASVKTAADNLNTLVTAETPQIHAALGNLVVTSDNLKATSATLRTAAAQVSPQLVVASNSLQQTAANLETASAGIDASVTEFNRKCGGGADDCGTLAGVNKAVHSIRMAAGQITAFSEHETGQRDLMNQQEVQLAGHADESLVKLGQALDGITGMIDETAQAWHKFLHPAWPKKVWSGITGAALPVAKIFF